jgi:probable HAF family extracellular repeat protein
MTDLATLGGYTMAINENGQVIGDMISLPNGGERAVLWQDGSIVDLGMLGQEGDSYTLPRAINSKGQVVGHSGSYKAEHAFLWENGQMLDLGTLGGIQSLAYAINDQTQIVGDSLVSPIVHHAFLWQNGTMVDLGTLGGNWSQAVDINERGQIVGASYVTKYLGHAFLWENGKMIDLGKRAGWQESNAVAINDQGQIIGDAHVIYVHAFLWMPPARNITVMIDIKPGSVVNPINLKSKGVVPVAVIHTDEFDTARLDPATVRFAGAAPLRWIQNDVDSDGDMDLLFHFSTKALALTRSSLAATLTGSTFDGVSVQGTDKIKIVPVSHP